MYCEKELVALGVLIYTEATRFFRIFLSSRFCSCIYIRHQIPWEQVKNQSMEDTSKKDMNVIRSEPTLQTGYCNSKEGFNFCENNNSKTLLLYFTFPLLFCLLLRGKKGKVVALAHCMMTEIQFDFR